MVGLEKHEREKKCVSMRGTTSTDISGGGDRVWEESDATLKTAFVSSSEESDKYSYCESLTGCNGFVFAGIHAPSRREVSIFDSPDSCGC